MREGIKGERQREISGERAERERETQKIFFYFFLFFYYIYISFSSVFFLNIRSFYDIFFFFLFFFTLPT